MKGTAGHAALAEWYTNGLDDEKAIKVASDSITNVELETGWDMSSEWDELHIMLLRYFAWARVNDLFTALAVEQRFEIQIRGLTLMGYIDGIVQKGNYNYLLEHKFQKQASTQHIDLDAQVSIYMLAAYKLGYEPVGTMYNIIRMGDGAKANSEPVLRTIAHRNAEGLSVVEHELGNQMEEVQHFNEEGGQGDLKVFRNPTKDCHWDCSFYNVCLSINDCGDADSILKRFPKRVQIELVKSEEGAQE